MATDPATVLTSGTNGRESSQAEEGKAPEGRKRPLPWSSIVIAARPAVVWRSRGFVQIEHASGNTNAATSMFSRSATPALFVSMTCGQVTITLNPRSGSSGLEQSRPRPPEPESRSLIRRCSADGGCHGV